MTSVCRICFIRSDTLPGLMSCGPTYSAKVANSLNLRRIGEEAGEEMEALHEAGQQIDERLAVFPIGDLRLKARPQGVHLELHLRIRPAR